MLPTASQQLLFSTTPFGDSIEFADVRVEEALTEQRACSVSILEKGKPAVRLARKAKGSQRRVAWLPKGCWPIDSIRRREVSDARLIGIWQDLLPAYRRPLRARFSAADERSFIEDDHLKVLDNF